MRQSAASVRGDDATQIMKGIVGDSALRCQLTGEKTVDAARSGYCFTADGRDIQREIIEMGAALACPRYCRALCPVRTGDQHWRRSPGRRIVCDIEKSHSHCLRPCVFQESGCCNLRW